MTLTVAQSFISPIQVEPPFEITSKGIPQLNLFEGSASDAGALLGGRQISVMPEMDPLIRTALTGDQPRSFFSWLGGAAPKQESPSLGQVTTQFKNGEAEKIEASRNRCVEGLAVGVLGAWALKHPWPLVAGLTACIPSVWAQEKIGSEFQVNTYQNLEQGAPVVTNIGFNTFVVAWHSNGQDGSSYGIFGRRFNSQGSPLGPEFPVNTRTTSLQSLPSISSSSNGDFIVAWTDEGQDGDNYGIFAQRFTSIGLKIDPEFQVNTYTTSLQWFSSVSFFDNRDYIITWSSNGQNTAIRGVYGQTYFLNGTKISSELTVKSTPGGDYTNSAVHALPGGNFVSVWVSDDGSSLGVFGQIFTHSGSPVGSEFRANTYSTLDQYHPSVASFPDGNILVAWDSLEQENSTSGVYAQLLDPTGAKIDNEFKVNTHSPLGQVYPDATVLNNGNLVIVWESDGQDGSQLGIFGQIFNATGHKLGAEFQVNTYSTNNQQRPKITKLGSDSFVVVWQSFAQDGSDYGVYGQVLRDNTTDVTTTASTGAAGTTAPSGSSGTTASSGGSTTAFFSTSALTTRVPGMSTTPPSLPTASSSQDMVWLWALLGGVGALTCVGIGVTALILTRKSRETASSSVEELEENPNHAHDSVRNEVKKRRESSNSAHQDNTAYGSVPDATTGNSAYGSVPRGSSSESSSSSEYGGDYANIPKKEMKKRRVHSSPAHQDNTAYGTVPNNS